MTQRRGAGANSEQAKNNREEAAEKRTQQQIREMLDDPSVSSIALKDALKRRYGTLIVVGANTSETGEMEGIRDVGGLNYDGATLFALSSLVAAEVRDIMQADELGDEPA